MMQSSIIQYPNALLSQPSTRVEVFDAAVAQRVELLFAGLYSCKAWGFAAAQMGWMQRVLVADFVHYGILPDARYTVDGDMLAWEKLFPLVIINPEIEYLSEERVFGLENCMSFPGIPELMLERPKCVRVRYQNLTGASHVFEAEGLLSRMIQHEIDHMDGIVWLERMTPELLAETRAKYPHFFCA